MPTIKTKKEMNLPQLIEWAWDNDITNKEYICNEYKKKSVIFNLSGWAEFSDEFSYNPHDTFTVEDKEEITEDMEFHHTVERFISRYVNKYRYETHDNKSIKDILNNRPPHVETTHIYAEVDKELVLIWRDGKLVE